MSKIGYINVSMETFGGLLSLFFIICLHITRPRKSRLERLYIRMLVCNTVLLFCDASAWIFKGGEDLLSFYIVRLSNYLVFTLGYVMLVLFTHYLVSFLEELHSDVTRAPLYFMCGIMLLAGALVVISQFNDMYYVIDDKNVYHRQEWFWLSQIFGIIGMVINGSLLIRYRKQFQRKNFTAFVIYISLPLVALLFQILFYNIAVLYLATTICLLCIYMSIQMDLFQLISQKELELEKSNTAIMLSQIQPHFLYNALNTIHYLCRTEPAVAALAVENFSDYLRGNMDSLTTKNPISFERELKHLENYLAIERLRFPFLNIVYDLKAKGFQLPALTVQPLVENAIRYGVTRSERENGTVIISSWEDDHGWYFAVRDYGTGFVPSQVQQDNRSHIGISNTRKRLESICSGTLKVDSHPGEGTCVTVCIPKNDS